jgi:putative endonuclease
MSQNEKQFFVYMLTSARNGTLYIGVTSNLTQRIHQHKEKIIEGFTSKYNVSTLVWYEAHDNAESAITREKQLKKWNRAWKLKLIEENNLKWRDLYEDLLPAESAESKELESSSKRTSATRSGSTELQSPNKRTVYP